MATVGKPPSTAAPTRTTRVALVGNPNTGKSTLFNALAGLRVRTGNYPGVTIEKKIGRCRVGQQMIDLVDLPGTYSLAPRSPDELVAVEVLTGEVPSEPPVDAIVCVVNATVLQRNLFLVSQVLELGKPTVIALNMIDAAEARGLAIDLDKLSAKLGVPVVATSAAKRLGISELTAALEDVLSGATAGASAGSVADRSGVNENGDPAEPGAARSAQSNTTVPRDRPLPPAFYEICGELRAQLRTHACTTDATATRSDLPDGCLPDDYLIERMLLDRGGEAERRAVRVMGAGVLPAISAAREKLEEQLGNATDMECSARYTWAGNKLQGVVSLGSGSRGVTDWLDAILTHRLLGLVIFVALMFGIFQAIYTLAGWPMGWIEEGTGFVAELVTSLLDPGMLRSLLVDGVIAGVGGVLIFLPQIALLFFFLAVLEDCGYMARAAFLVDRLMTLFGLSGKSFLPLMSSFACAVPGVMATRVIENRRDRFATMMVAPLMSCSARLPVYLLLIAAFIPATKVLGIFSLPALTLMAMYLVGVVVAIPVSWILKRTLLRGEVAPFVLELPEYKAPAPSVVLSRVWEASYAFVVRAGTLIFAASIIIWFAGYWPGDHSEQFAMQAQLESLESESVDPQSADQAVLLAAAYREESSELLEGSLLGRIGHAIEPVVRPLGWDWKIGVGAVASFPAREVIIATLGTIYSLGGEVDAEDDSLIGAIRAAKWPDGRPVYTVPVALSVMVFFALCAQCVSTLLVIKRETNSWRWPIFSFTYMTALAYIGALLTYQIGSHLL